MPKRRANGEGNIRKRKDGRWEGRYTVGHDPETGKAIIKSVLSKTQAEVKEKLKKAIEENTGIDYGRAKTYTGGSWLEVWLENYAKVLNIEAETCLMMAEKEILPACMKFAGATAKAVNAMKTAGVEPYAEAHVLADVAERNAKLYKALEGLRGAVKATCHGDALECAKYEHNVIIPAMAAVREQADELETLVGKEYWPFPTYDDLLFNV